MTLGKPVTRIRYLENGAALELSRAIPDPLLDPPMRLLIEADREGLTLVGVIPVTSPTDGAEELRGGNARVFWCTKEDLRWFIEQLPRALAFLETGEKP